MSHVHRIMTLNRRVLLLNPYVMQNWWLTAIVDINYTNINEGEVKEHTNVARANNIDLHAWRVVVICK